MKLETYTWSTKKADSWHNRSVTKIFINLWKLLPICENKGIYLSFLIEIENVYMADIREPFFLET